MPKVTPIRTGETKPDIYTDIRMSVSMSPSPAEDSHFISAELFWENEENPATLTIFFNSGGLEDPLACKREVTLPAEELDRLILCLTSLRERVALAGAVPGQMEARPHRPTSSGQRRARA